LLASLPILVGIFYVYGALFSTRLFLLWGREFLNSFFYFCIIFAFLIRIPMFLVHLWLPRAHVEAPVSGSMVLAGILLKLGGYGLLRVFPLLSNFFNLGFIWISIRLVGGFLVSLICIRQTDLKSLIAYSSIAHIGIVIGGIMTISYWGFCGSFTLMIAHGLCSSGLFCLANISYERLGSRRLLVSRGMLSLIPRISFWWFILSSCNMAAPPSLNLLGEIRLLNSLISWSWFSIFLLMFLSFFRAAYTLYLFSYRQHGLYYSGVYSCSLGYSREFLLLFLHWFPLNFFIMRGDFAIFWL
jgi:NADH-ubiquinone oxidoreductase chain 4